VPYVALAIVAGLAAVERKGFLQAMLSRPIALATITGWTLGDLRGGVLLAARPRSGLISIEIWDTGPGIRQNELDRIFEEFYRGESSKAENSGA